MEEPQQGSKVILVFFIGGITMAEISAIRYLSKITNNEYIIGTTKLINGNTFIESLFEQVGNIKKRTVVAKQQEKEVVQDDNKQQ
jgi:hypothetical protein